MFEVFFQVTKYVHFGQLGPPRVRLRIAGVIYLMVRSGASVRIRMSGMAPPCTFAGHIRSLQKSNDEVL